jgi:hypothetical protein
MTETPDEWLDDLFEFEFCAECGGDAVDHEVCIVPGMGTFFARCLRMGGGDPTDDDPHANRPALLVHDCEGERGEFPIGLPAGPPEG